MTGGEPNEYIARNAMTDSYIGPKQHLLVMGGLVFGGLVLACLPNAVLGLQYQCMLHRMTGLRCPFCGMTRDFILMAHGSLPRNNPSSLVVALALYVAYPLWLVKAALGGQFRLLIRRERLMHALLIAMLLLFVANNLVA